MNVLIVGVGGQGTLLASKVLGNLAISSGFDIKVSEVHGMAQRGGSVVTHVRWGEKIHSPLVDIGNADIIIAFEKLEAFRWIPYLKKNGKMLINTQEINPMPVILGAAEYPQEIIYGIRAKGIDVTELDALALAKEAGSAKAVNIVLLGLLANILDFSEDQWQKALEATVKPKLIELNRKAFALGRACVVKI